MTQEIKTIELAKLYESQGHHEEALDIYKTLDEQNSSAEIKAGVKRMEKLIESPGQGGSNPEKKISALFEKWLMLMVLKQRLNNFKKIKARLS